MKGVLIGNLGTTKSPKEEDVKEYLDEFLMDKRAMDLPRWLRALVVRGIILKTRPPKTAANYRRIWREDGSPLLVHSKNLTQKVDEAVDVPVVLAMRYGEPSVKSGLQELVDQGVDEILLLPLYPQYAMATTETFVVLAEELGKEHFPQVKFSTLPAFYNFPEYIEVLSKSIAEKLEGVDYDHLLFSYHGVPERHIRKTDITDGHCKIDGQCCQTKSPAHQFCYRHQCLETTRLTAEKLQLKPGTYSSSFQSKLGIDAWLKPPTDKTVKEFGKQGMKSLAIVTPAFVADCIETIDEIGREAKEDFQESGGGEFTFVPCLNDRNDWAEVVNNWIKDWVRSSQKAEA